MLDVTVEQSDNILIFHVRGVLSLYDFVELICTYCPMIRHHAIYDFSEASVDSSVTETSLHALADIAQRQLTNRNPEGKSAHVSSVTDTLGIQSIIASIICDNSCPHEQAVFKSMDEAVLWLSVVAQGE